jgi:flavodoxin
MKALVVYDSLYGNTAQVAKAIGGAISDETKVLPVGEVNPSDLKSLDLLIAGGPTQGGRPSKPMQAFLKELPNTAIEGVNVAAFDTRMTTKWVKLFGYAAGKIGKALKKKGGNLLLKAEPFWVTGGKGPLKEGELERAAQWTKELVKDKE